MCDIPTYFNIYSFVFLSQNFLKSFVFIYLYIYIYIYIWKLTAFGEVLWYSDILRLKFEIYFNIYSFVCCLMSSMSERWVDILFGVSKKESKNVEWKWICVTQWMEGNNTSHHVFYQQCLTLINNLFIFILFFFLLIAIYSNLIIDFSLFFYII